MELRWSLGISSLVITSAVSSWQLILAREPSSWNSPKICLATSYSGWIHIDPIKMLAMIYTMTIAWGSTTAKPIATWTSQTLRSRSSSTDHMKWQPLRRKIEGMIWPKKDPASKNQWVDVSMSSTKTSPNVYGNSSSIVDTKTVSRKTRSNLMTLFISNTPNTKDWLPPPWPNSSITSNKYRDQKKWSAINAFGSWFPRKEIKMDLKIAIHSGRGISSLDKYWHMITLMWKLYQECSQNKEVLKAEV